MTKPLDLSQFIFRTLTGPSRPEPCACGNEAELGSDRCTECLDAELAAMDKIEERTGVRPQAWQLAQIKAVRG